MEKETRRRLLRVALAALALAAAAALFLALRPPCLILKSTGLYCGACGFTRMVEELLQGNVGAAFRQNPYMFVLLPWQGLTWRERRPAISGSGRPCGNGNGCRRCWQWQWGRGLCLPCCGTCRVLRPCAPSNRAGRFV